MLTLCRLHTITEKKINYFCKHKQLLVCDAEKILKGINNMEEYNLLTINKIGL